MINPKFHLEWENIPLEWKMNRIIEYISRLIKGQDLSIEVERNIRRMMITALKKDELDVEYDQNKGHIVDIPNVKYDEEKGYYLEDDSEDSEITFKIVQASSIS